jgi:hypothetical protein
MSCLAVTRRYSPPATKFPKNEKRWLAAIAEERKEMARRDRGDGYPERRVPGVKNRRTKEIIPCRSGTDGIAEYRRHCGQVPETEQAVVDEKERYQEAFWVPETEQAVVDEKERYQEAFCT